MEWKQTEFVHKCPMSTAWDHDFFYSNVYPPNSSTQWIDTDTPANAIFENNDIRYKFNEYGFRSDHFYKEADIKLLVNGCSMTVGVGIEYEKTWPRLLKKKIENETSKTVLVWNLAISGASGDYVARSMSTLYFKLKPDLMFIYWPPIGRLELPDINNEKILRQYQVGQTGFPKELVNENYLNQQRNKNRKLIKMNAPRNRDRMFENKEDVFFDTYARDGQHPGEDWHERVAEMFFKLWLDK